MDSRECPGPSSEATLHRPSPRRALTAGAIALAAVAPAIDPIESPVDSLNALPALVPVRADSPSLAVHDAFQARMMVAARPSRSAARRALPVRPAARLASRRPPVPATAGVAGPAVFVAVRHEATGSPAVRFRGGDAAGDRAAGLGRGHAAAAARDRSRQVRRVARSSSPAARHQRTYRMVVTRHAVTVRSTRRVALGGGMSAVIAYARSQVGRRYVTGGTGGSGFDCSGLTQQAYARAGIALPHSSWAQAARARGISPGLARPGDLVVGRGHVGIYMGRGMMIDAGNHRTGVVYRKLYSGLRLERL